jgi:hypothetical protein
MRRNFILLLACSLAAAAPIAAQKDTSAAPATLDARMQAFFREIPREPNDALAAFFPRRGDWTWVQTVRDMERGRPPRTGVWRFPGAETVRVIGVDGPACPSFDHIRGEFGPFEGKFGMQMMMHPGPWRRVRGNRFVPPGASDRSTVFVEWRREDGEWVVSTIGDEEAYLPRLLGVEANSVSRDTLLAPEGAAYAAGQAWYVDRLSIQMDERIYLPYGPPRPLSLNDLRRVGVLDRVSVYAERREPAEEVLYIPISPGEYQPYQTIGPDPCR